MSEKAPEVSIWTNESGDTVLWFQDTLPDPLLFAPPVDVTPRKKPRKAGEKEDLGEGRSG